MCSYRHCQEGGVKFRYCSECRLPVAKRNFHQRHSHGLAASRRTLLPPSIKPHLQGGVVESTHDSRKESKPRWTTTNQQEDAPTSTEQATRRPIMPHHDQQQDHVVEEEGFVDRGHPKTVCDKKPPQPQHNKQSKQPRGAAAGADGGPQILANDVLKGTTEVLTMTAASRETTLLVREWEWAELLHRRPPSSDTEAISKWLFEVMSISEFPQPPLHDAKERSNHVNNDDSMTAMDRRKTQRRPPIKDNPNDYESVDDGDEQRRFLATNAVSSVSEGSPCKKQQSAKVQKMHDERPFPKDDGPTSRAKKRKC